MEAKKIEIERLVKWLNKKTREYNSGHPSVSDEAWDEKYFRLVKLERETGYYMKGSPTQTISFEKIDELKKVKHDHPMLSLDKRKKVEELKEYFQDKGEIVAMSKMDGLTCSLTYLHGKLVRAETRGNGEVGENVLHNASVISNIPKRIPITKKLVVDGEVFCDYKTFQKNIYCTTKKNPNQTLSHPRNYAAGAIRMLSSKESHARQLKFIAWDCIEGLPLKAMEKLTSKLKALNECGFLTVPFFVSPSYEEMIKIIKKISKKFSYPIDGVVFKINDTEKYYEEGKTYHHFKGGLAYKFSNQMYVSTLREIIWQPSRTGLLTPVLRFDPVEIDGAIIQRATGVHYQLLRDTLGIPYIGQEIRIVKANDIIPRVIDGDKTNLSKVDKKNFLLPPKFCPVCGQPTKIMTGKDGHPEVRCVNSSCEAVSVQRFVHFTGKSGLDIRGLGPKTLECIYNLDILHTYKDIFFLKDHLREIYKLPLMGLTKTQNLLDSIDAARHCTLENFISAISIPTIGKHMARLLAKHFEDWDRFRKAVDENFNFAEIPGFDYKRSKILKFFDYTEADEVAKILEFEKNEDYIPLEDDMRFSGAYQKVFVITGRFKTFKSREILAEHIKEHGGIVRQAVNGKTDFLIVGGDKNKMTRKLKMAIERKVPILDEQQYIDLATSSIDE